MKVEYGWRAVADTHDTPTYWQIAGKDCDITIEPRPAYCDRGNWLAKVHVRNSRELSIDHQDMWPRYYMDLDRAKLEIEDWMKKRGQWV